MGHGGCSADGELNQAEFSKPLPWIGIYIAAASLLCGAAMAADAISGFRQRKFWFPCKYFTFNATTLTLIAVATKLSLDLNTPMPSGEEQLTKLSSTVLVCTVMGNSMPSLGAMESKELAMNIMALGILVITIIVNTGIQLGTGVIYVFWKEHAFIMFLMFLLLIVLSFTALTVPTIKTYLELKYKKKYEFALKVKESQNGTDNSVIELLKRCLMRHWMMAHTCAPQFVIGRSVACTASGALCLLGAATLAEAMLRYHLMRGSFKFCRGESDYKWSIILVFIIQSTAIAVGTLAPAMRWFAAINFRCRKRKQRSYKEEFKLERYWIQQLVELKEYTLVKPTRNRRFRKFVHDGKNLILNVCIRIQRAIVFTSKVIQLISIYFVSQVLLVSDYCKWQLGKFDQNNRICIDPELESHPSPMWDLRHFVLYLEGEQDLVAVMINKTCDTVDYWTRKAQRKRPKHLMKLLELSRISERFKGLIEFDNETVPSLDSQEPPNCWALPLVTLASIAVALPSISQIASEELTRGLNEGLMYTRLVEQNLNAEEDLQNVRKAAEVVWVEVELYHKWLGLDLRKLSTQGKTSREVLELLAESAEKRFMEYKAATTYWCLLDNPSKWPIKVLAANAMYRISKTILLSYASKDYQTTSENLFQAITLMISDILGACLTNLRHVIKTKCLSRTIEEREASVRHAAYLLGKTEEILKLLDDGRYPNPETKKAVHLDEWRSLHKVEVTAPHFTPTSSESGTAPSSPDETYVTIGLY